MNYLRCDGGGGGGAKVLLLLQAPAVPSWLDEKAPLWQVVVSHRALQCNSVNSKITKHLHARSTQLGIYSQEFVLLNCMSYWHIEMCSVEVRVRWHWGWPGRKNLHLGDIVVKNIPSIVNLHWQVDAQSLEGWLLSEIPRDALIRAPAAVWREQQQFIWTQLICILPTSRHIGAQNQISCRPRFCKMYKPLLSRAVMIKCRHWQRKWPSCFSCTDTDHERFLRTDQESGAGNVLLALHECSLRAISWVSTMI